MIRAAARLAALSIVAAVAAPALVCSGALAAGPAPHRLVALRGEVAPGLRAGLASGALRPVRAGRAERQGSVTLTLVLRRSDQAGFDRFLAAAHDPRTPQRGHVLGRRALAARFGPSAASYDRVLGWLRARGFRLVQGSADRLTLTVRGTRAQAQRAFHVAIGSYAVRSRGPVAARRVHANAGAPSVPAAIATRLTSVSGLSDLGRPTGPMMAQENADGNALVSECYGSLMPTPGIGGALISAEFAFVKALGLLAYETATSSSVMGFAMGAAAWGSYCLGLVVGYGLGSSGAFGGLAPHGPRVTGPRAGSALAQKIGLVEFDTFRRSDVIAWLQMLGVSASAADGLHESPVNGGVASPGPGEPEVLLDVDTVLGLLSRSSNIIVDVHDAPPTTDFAAVFNAMIDDGDTIISNSWAQCEDQTPPAATAGIDSVLAQAQARGITVLNGAGDHGSTCLDGSPDTVAVPADSPHATAVGGSSVKLGPGLTYKSGSWWNDPAGGGQGGFGVSMRFARPVYQDGLTSAAGRSVPDLAPVADPRAGLQICQADAGGCPSGLLYGGTSMAAPEAAALVAHLDQVRGANIGNLNAALYPLAGTRAFHTATDLGSDFAHVGLGDLNLPALQLALEHATAGPVDAAGSGAVAVSGIPADGQKPGLVRVDLRDAQGHPVSGKVVTLTAVPAGSAVIGAASGPSDGTTGSVTFTVTDTVAEKVTLTATDTTDGVVLTTRPAMTFQTPSAAGATIAASPGTVVDDGSAATTISVYLQDNRGRPSPGKTIALAESNGSASIAPGSHQAVTGADGVATFTATDAAAESVAFTATDASDGNLRVPGSATVNFQPAGASSCVDTPPTPAGGSGLDVATFASGIANNDHPFTTFSGGITFTTSACVGVETPAFDASGNVFVPAPVAGQVYAFGRSGGVAGPETALSGGGFGPGELVGGLAFGKSGELYASRYRGGDFTKPEIVQLDPATGAVGRSVITWADGLPDFPVYLAVDPVSGDLFSVDDGSGAGTGNDNVSRVAGPAGAHPTVAPFANVGGVQTGLTFAPDGTMYVGVVTGPNTNAIVAATGTASPSPGTVAKIITLPNAPFGVSVAGTDPQGHATSLIVVESGGDIDRIDLTGAPATSTTIASRASSFSTGGAIGPDGCLYYDDQDKVLKVSGVSAACPAGAASTGPQLTLTADGPSSPATGTSATFTARLAGVVAPQDTPIHLIVSGANTQQRLAEAGADGVATLAYSGILTGGDTIRAVADLGGGEVSSAPLRVRWVAGRDTTALLLNGSQESGTLGQRATLTARLTNISQAPAAPVASASIPITVGGQTCTAVTDAAGVASCALTAPTTPGLAAVTATYAGSTVLTPSSASGVFAAGGVGTPPAQPAAPGPSRPSVRPPTAAAPQTSPALACTSAKIVLINVFARGRRVVISGAARLDLAGRRVQIRLVHGRRALGSATIGADGTFALTVALPARAIRTTNKASYEAFVGLVHSSALKLTRRMVVTRASVSGGRVRLAGTVGPPRIRKSRVTIRVRATCRRYRTVAVVALRQGGAWSASLPAPKDGGPASLYRAQARVRAGRRIITTYSLPVSATG
jgi:hypothetical protein